MPITISKNGLLADLSDIYTIPNFAGDHNSSIPDKEAGALEPACNDAGALEPA